MKEPTLGGRWHHGNGVLVSGTLRIATANFDTNPPIAMQEAIFEEICQAMNEKIAAYEAAREAAIPRCRCCGTAENLHRDLGSGGPYRCDSPDCVVF